LNITNADQRKKRIDGDFFSKPEGQAEVFEGTDFSRLNVGQYLR